MKKALATAFGVAALLGGAVTATPAAATYPYRIDIVNDGAASIVAGSAQKAQFKITVTVDELPIETVEQGPGFIVPITAWLPDGLELADYPDDACTSVGNMINCDLESESTTASLDMKATASAYLRPGTYHACATIWDPDAPPLDTPQPIRGNCPLGAPEVGEYPMPLAEASVEVTNDADLQLAASQPGQVDPGAGATITWTATNAGPSAADSPLTLTAKLPAGVSWVSGGEAPWACTASGQDVTCTYIPVLTAEPVCAEEADPACDAVPVIMPSDPIPPVKWNVTTSKPGKVAKYDIEAKVTSPTTDSKPANNSATATINVTPVDLAISKTAGSPVFVDDEATWTLNVRNVGTIDDTAKIAVTDTLPSAAKFVSASGDGWTCTAAGQKVTCTRDGLPKGASSDILVISAMTSRGDATNKAEVSTESYEKNTSDNAAEKMVRVVRVAQTAPGLPPSPSRVKSGKTEQGQQLTTRVSCRPVKSSAAGEVSFCKVTRKNGVVRIKVKGTSPMKVTVVQTAKGTAKFLPFVQRKTYLVKP